jgi:hypothetical protein
VPKTADPFAAPRTYEEYSRHLVANEDSVPVLPPKQPQTQLTTKLAEDLITLVQEGMTIKDAARLMLVPTGTIQSWFRMAARDPTSEYAWFATRIEQAQALFIQEMVANVRANARRDGHVALKVLEKAAAGSWEAGGANVKVSGTVVHEHVGVELARIVERRKALQAGKDPDTEIEGEIVREEEVQGV